MAKEFDHKKIEKKWQKKWKEEELHVTPDEVEGKENYYTMFEFPYPSGNLHIGHWYAYTVPDIFARYKRMRGYNVLYPIGFDAFGLPAENAAIKRDLNPREWTYGNIQFMKKQVKNMGCSFDWNREIITADPSYYKWTQWLFLQFIKQDLAYQEEQPVNWCPSCKTGLANEQVVQGLCERCDSKVEKRPMKQWMLKITDYADRLLEDIDELDWPEEIKTSQKNWIGKKEGARFTFEIQDPSFEVRKIEVFTTRPDTFYGVTFLVISPEKADEWMREGWGASDDVSAYVREALDTEKEERLRESKEKTGVDTGIRVKHPGTGEELSVWVADYVLGGYGTGAIMAVPAHDERDHAFREKYDLPIKEVVVPYFVDENNPHKDDQDVVERETVQAIIRNKKTGKYLVLRWKEHDWTTFVIGGVEEGESPREAIEREIYEETGYKNVTLVKQFPGTVCSDYFAPHKGENRRSYTTGFLFELEDDDQDEISAEEKAKHEIEWVERNELTPENMTCSELEMWLTHIDGEQEQVYTGGGVVVNSGCYSGRGHAEAAKKITETYGVSAVTFNLRDWNISRQRYWGCPIPVVHCDSCGAVPVPVEELPVELPPIEDYLPRDDGRSPLAKATEWVEVACPTCGEKAERETDTFDTFIDSSWYFLRYLDPKNKDEFASTEKQQRWMPVDIYSGGAEHTTMHLLYSRFVYKALFDMGLVTHKEPYKKRLNRGLILGPDGQKMSKSRGNVIDPDDFVEKVGADSVRTYLAFIGPYNEGGTYPWDLGGVVGVRRFFERVYELTERVSDEENNNLLPLLHRTIKRVEEPIKEYKFNTSVSALMEAVNTLGKEEKIPRSILEMLIRLIAPFAPHLAEEMWEELGHTSSVHLESWPVWDEAHLKEETIEMVVQVNGKVRATFEVERGVTEEAMRERAYGDEGVKKYLESGEVKRVIFVPNRLINFVVE